MASLLPECSSELSMRCICYIKVLVTECFIWETYIPFLCSMLKNSWLYCLFPTLLKWYLLGFGLIQKNDLIGNNVPLMELILVFFPLFYASSIFPSMLLFCIQSVSVHKEYNVCYNLKFTLPTVRNKPTFIEGKQTQIPWHGYQWKTHYIQHLVFYCKKDITAMLRHKVFTQSKHTYKTNIISSPLREILSLCIWTTSHDCKLFEAPCLSLSLYRPSKTRPPSFQHDHSTKYFITN